jgi:membrane protease YdiL (CAAX protease family)
MTPEGPEAPHVLEAEEADPLALPAPPPPRRAVRARGLLIVAGLWIAAFAVGGPLRDLALAGVEVAPFVLLGWLAHLGRQYLWARVLSWVGAALLVLVAAVALAGLAGLAWEHQPHLAPALLALAGALGCAGALATPLARPLLRALGMDPTDHVHRLALFVCVGLALICLAPLLATGRALLLDFITTRPDLDFQLTAFDHLLPLVWIGPGAFLLVGFGVHRTLGESARRLGLTWPGRGGLLWGIGAGLALVPAALVVGYVLEITMQSLGMSTAPEAELDRLFGLSSMTLVTALGLSISAGVGEELVVRGVLQPRLGLLLANLLFAALHAPQYTLDGVIVVCLLGVAFGMLRRRTSTLVSMLAHAIYDFALIVLIIQTTGG